MIYIAAYPFVAILARIAVAGERTMHVTFRRSSAVVIGSFNMYIIEPNWMVRKGLLPDNTEVIVENKLDEPAIRYSGASLGALWLVTPNRVVIESESESFDCGGVLASLLAHLPETPIRSVGNNCIYGIDGHPGFPAMGVVAPPASYIKRMQSFHYQLVKDETEFNVQLSFFADKTELLTNATRHILEMYDPKSAISHGRRFEEHRRVGLELAEHHLGVI